MKTTGMKHQLTALERLLGRAYYALFMEQGTGKTWTLLADAERAYLAGKADCVLVLAPKGVHTNWIRREIPAHLSVPVLAASWKSGMGKRATEALNKLLVPGRERLRILSVNYDALITKAGFAFAQSFAASGTCIIIADESSRIKNPDSARTKRALQLRRFCRAARIATGTPITNSPADVFSQMQFLRPGLLGTDSFRAFNAEYAELLGAHHPLMQDMIKRNPRAATAQVVARNPDGSPRWRNLDQLKQRLEPHSFRVLKRDCLDLPEKVFQTMFFELDAKQQKAYDLMETALRIELEDGSITPVAALAALGKLRQITSGFVMLPDRPPLYVSDGNPRLDALMEALEDVDGSVIIWAHYREELRAVSERLTKAGITHVQYHGGVSAADREEAVDAFQSRRARAFLGQQQSGGIGLTLTAATTAVYFSNNFSLEGRLQSEDRCHRIGTTESVVYIDIVAEDTIDESITRALQRKADLASTILGDRQLPLPPLSTGESSLMLE